MPRATIGLLIVCAALAHGQARAEQVAAADVQAAAAVLADPDPAVARGCCRALIKSARAGNLDADARAKLAEAANRRLEAAVTIVKAGLADPRVKAAATTHKKELDAARSKALALIESEERYPEGPPGGEPQQAVDAAVAEAERLAAERPQAVLNALPGLAAQAALALDLAELLGWLDAPRTGRLSSVYKLEAELQAATDPDLNGSLPALAINAFGPGPDGAEAAVERRIFEQVNAYRLALGLGVLSFDERLYRAAAWFAKESFEKKLNGHICDTPGRRDPLERAGAEGHAKCNGECVAYNGTHFEDWRKSASHHRVLVERRQSQVGAVAVFGNVAVLMTGLKVPYKGARPPMPTTAQMQLWEAMARAAWGRSRGDAAGLLVGLGRAFSRARMAAQAQEVYRAALSFDAQAPGVPLELRKPAAPVTPPAQDGLHDADFGKRRMAWIAYARQDPAAARNRALAALQGDDRAARADAAAALEALGGGENVDALLEVFDRDLSDYAVIRALEFLTGRGTGMHFGDTREQREAKVKAVREAWAAHKSE